MGFLLFGVALAAASALLFPIVPTWGCLLFAAATTALLKWGVDKVWAKPATEVADAEWVRRAKPSEEQQDSSAGGLKRPFLARRPYDELPLDIARRVEAHQDAKEAVLPPSLQELIRREAGQHRGRMLRHARLGRPVLDKPVSRPEQRVRLEKNDVRNAFGQSN